MWSIVKGYFILCGIILMESILLVGLQNEIIRYAGRQEDIYRNMQNQIEAVGEDMVCFPIPKAYRKDISYEDTYGASRVQGMHQGCDLMDLHNNAGQIPIVSATDGVITNLGWLYLGGYRIGVTSERGIYYYYAHLDSYAVGIAVGKEVCAGELLGFMGNTGEGEEKTMGKMPVHLHFAIYIREESGNEESVNSYEFLQKLDER